MKGRLIQDVTPVRSFDTIPKEELDRVEASKLPSEVMVSELYERGVSIQTIFGQYYALEEMGNAHSDQVFGNDEDGQHGRKPLLTVGDAELAGYGTLPDKPIARQPF